MSQPPYEHTRPRTGAAGEPVSGGAAHHMTIGYPRRVGNNVGHPVRYYYPDELGSPPGGLAPSPYFARKQPPPCVDGPGDGRVPERDRTALVVFVVLALLVVGASVSGIMLLSNGGVLHLS